MTTLGDKTATWLDNTFLHSWLVFVMLGCGLVILLLGFILRFSRMALREF